MPTPARTSLLLLVLLAPAAALGAEEAALGAVELLIREGARAEQAERCEAAFGKYREAAEGIGRLADRARAAELDAIVTNKLDKLEPCQLACQPSERQRSLMADARAYAARGEPRRATLIARRLLVGRDERCEFWGEARAFLRTLPRQAEEQDGDKVDPCAVAGEIAAQVQAVQDETRHHLADLALLEDEKRLPGKLQELIGLYRAMDDTRMRLFELREQFIDCESVYAPLSADARELRGSFGRTQELIFATYQGQVSGLSKKIRTFKRRLAKKDEELKGTREKLAAHADELERLKSEFDALSEFNETLFDDLFALAGAESITFATQVEGRRVEQPMEEIRELVADQAKVLQALETRYPEYFADGVNVEALRRKRLVLGQFEKVLGRFEERGAGDKLGFERAMAELGTTIQMMDRTIDAHEGEPRRTASPAAGRFPLVPVAGGAGVVLLAGAAIAVARRRRRRAEAEADED